MLKDTLEIRLFSLKLEGDGFNKKEIVKELGAIVKVLCAKLGCSEATVYNGLTHGLLGSLFCKNSLKRYW